MRPAKPMLVLLALGLWHSAVATSEGAATRQGGIVYELVSPSGNIRCAAYVGGSRTGTMRCSLRRMARTYPRPAAEQGCDWEGGRWYALEATGPGSRFAPCDALLSSKPPLRLAYGKLWRRGPFSCLSTRLALVCTNLRGHGLLLSFEQQRTF
jgi:hypothetical protein